MSSSDLSVSNDRSGGIKEAIAAADEALGRLREARDKLDRASSWGLADIMGLGAIGTFVKHRRINDARACLERARESVQRFARELSSVAEVNQLHIEMGDFLTLADFLFDNFVVDIAVQQEINAARENVGTAINRVSSLRADLIASS